MDKDLETRSLDVSTWVEQSKCRNLETRRWYPPRDKELYQIDATYAKGVCKGKDGKPPCPVRHQCLLFALLTDEEHGIWGGMSHRERAALVRKAEKAGVNLPTWVATKVK